MSPKVLSTAEKLRLETKHRRRKIQTETSSSSSDSESSDSESSAASVESSAAKGTDKKIYVKGKRKRTGGRESNSQKHVDKKPAARKAEKRKSGFARQAYRQQVAPPVVESPTPIISSAEKIGKVQAKRLSLGNTSTASSPIEHADKRGTGSPDKVASGSKSASAIKPVKKRKRLSPFRIRAGCLVALRVQPEGNSCWLLKYPNTQEGSEEPPQYEASRSIFASQSAGTDGGADASDFVSVWTNPLPGRDEGLALIGKRIRCFFPNLTSTTTTTASNTGDSRSNDGNKKKRRILEGEIISLLEQYSYHGSASKMDGEASPPVLRRQHSNRVKVELLVDKNTVLDHFSFLPRTDVNRATVASDNGSVHKRNLALEESIRGENKVTVKVKLAHPSKLSITPTGQEGILQWAILKRVPAKLFHRPAVARKNKLGDNDNQAMAGGEETQQQPTGTTRTTTTNGDENDDAAPRGGNKKRRKNSSGSLAGPSTAPVNSSALVVKHIGDGIDSADQQIANWRWFAGRYHDMLLSWTHHSVDPIGPECLSNGFVGEVIKVESIAKSSQQSSPISTLAMVTVRRLILPEHTATGRLPWHGPFDVFDVIDDSLPPTASSSNLLLLDETMLQVPIEQLVIISRGLDKQSENNLGNEDFDPPMPISDGGCLETLAVPLAYSLRIDVYGSSGKQQQRLFCHRCRRSIPEHDDAVQCTKGCPSSESSSSNTVWCKSCLQLLQAIQTFSKKTNTSYEEHDENDLPCCRGTCDCRTCRAFSGSELHHDFQNALKGALEMEEIQRQEQADVEENGSSYEPDPDPFAAAASMIRYMDPIDFGLPFDFVDPSTLPMPAGRPSIRTKARKTRRQLTSKGGRASAGRKQNDKATARTKGAVLADALNGKSAMEERDEDYSVFKPKCARILTYDAQRRHCKAVQSTFSSSTTTANDKPRNLRMILHESRLLTDKQDDHLTRSSRAARASQRRFMKDVAAMGATVDALAKREPQLRFDRSGIHAWGVFADEDIAAGEMIIEYRGEIIGNALAEKREKEYEAAKIGSDYMFRIDSTTVCDATKQGNVARFINASCDPNCYTKIITTDGVKRIVIYSKKDIKTGDELCYDYKFPIEYDESKRIPCYCGAKDCRGFMNWDKRYVAIPEQKGETKAPIPDKQRVMKRSSLVED